MRRIVPAMLALSLALTSVTCMAISCDPNPWDPDPFIGKTEYYSVITPFIFHKTLPAPWGPIAIEVTGFNGFADLAVQVGNGETGFLFDAHTRSVGKFWLDAFVSTSCVDCESEIEDVGEIGTLFDSVAEPTGVVVDLAFAGPEGWIHEVIGRDDVEDGEIEAWIEVDAETAMIVVQTNEPWTPEEIVEFLLRDAFPGIGAYCIRQIMDAYRIEDLFIALHQAYNGRPPFGGFDVNTFLLWLIGPVATGKMATDDTGNDVIEMCMYYPTRDEVIVECLRDLLPPPPEEPLPVDGGLAVTVTYAYLLEDGTPDVLLFDTMAFDVETGCYSYDLSNGDWLIRPGEHARYPLPGNGLLFIGMGIGPIQASHILLPIAVMEDGHFIAGHVIFMVSAAEPEDRRD